MKSELAYMGFKKNIVSDTTQLGVPIIASSCICGMAIHTRMMHKTITRTFIPITSSKLSNVGGHDTHDNMHTTLSWGWG